MIIRRRHTANFTVVPNAVFNDGRLSLDEKGALGWLLSRPHDWEVSRAACARAWSVGREKATRIFKALVGAGWAVREVVRSEQDGTILGVRYVISDEPSSVPADAASALDTDLDESSADDADGEESVGAAVDDASTVSSLQQTGLPATGEPLPEKPYGRLSTDKILNQPPLSPPEPAATPQGNQGQPGSNASPENPATFAAMLRAWPPDHVQSPFQAERKWKRFGDRDRTAALAAVGPYLGECRSVGRKVCDLSTFLGERRFDRFTAKAGAAKPYLAEPGTPQHARWREYLIAEHGPNRVAMMDDWARQGRAYAVPSEWPPSREARSTDPPDRQYG